MIEADKRKAMYLLHQEGMSLKELVRRFKLSRNTVRAIIREQGEMPVSNRRDKIRIDTDLLGRLYLECDGWIQRVPAESDRRRKLIRPTTKVEPLWAKMVDCAHRVRARATEGLNAEQLAQLRDTLDTIRTNLTAAPVET